VFDAVMEPLARRLGLDTRHRVERLLDGAVADGVDGALPAGTVGAADQGPPRRTSPFCTKDP